MRLRPCFMLAAVAILYSGYAAFEASGQAAAALPKWSPDEAMVKNLDPATSVGEYTIQPPKKYQFEKQQGKSAGLTMFAWRGPARADGTWSSLAMSYIVLPPASQEKHKNDTLEQLADNLIGTFKRSHNSFQQEKTETGVINGVNFARIRWKGVDTGNNGNSEGIVYVCRDGKAIIQFVGLGFVPETKQTLPVLEASIMTFKKKKA